jgi:hypothetical protein
MCCATQGWSVMGRVAAANVSQYERATSWEELGNLPHIRRRARASDRAHRGDP